MCSLFHCSCPRGSKLLAFLIAAILVGTSDAVTVGLDGHAEDPIVGHGTLAQDVTVVVFVKESPISGSAPEKLLESIPSAVPVYYYLFEPFTDVNLTRHYEDVVGRYENARIVRGLPLYSIHAEIRRHALENIIKTKYFLSVENIASFGEGFVERLYAAAERVREDELLRHGDEKTVVFLPRLVETCDYERSMWSRKLHQSHSQFQPRILESESTEKRYFAMGYLGGQKSGVKFPLDDMDIWETADHPDASEWINAPLAGKDVGFDDIHAVHFLEDHVFLGDTQFFQRHSDYLCRQDLFWFDDHMSQMAVIQAFDKQIVMVPDLVAVMEFFCTWSLESLPIVAWRRADDLMVRSCELEEVIFGTTATYNCWHWTNSVKRGMFGGISVLDVTAEIPSFGIGVPLAPIRRANLIISTLLLSSYNLFMIEEREAVASMNGDTLGGLISSTRWMESREALVTLYQLLGCESDCPTNSERYLYLRAKKEFISVLSDRYIADQQQAGGLLQPLPTAFRGIPSQPNGDTSYPDGKEVVTSFNDKCIYRSDIRKKSDRGMDDDRLTLRYTNLVLEYADAENQDDPWIYELLWSSCEVDGIFVETGATLLSEDDRIRIPSSPYDDDVLVRNFKGNRL